MQFVVILPRRVYSLLWLRSDTALLRTHECGHNTLVLSSACIQVQTRYELQLIELIAQLIRLNWAMSLIGVRCVSLSGSKSLLYSKSPDYDTSALSRNTSKCNFYIKSKPVCAFVGGKKRSPAGLLHPRWRMQRWSSTAPRGWWEVTGSNGSLGNETSAQV